MLFESPEDELIRSAARRLKGRERRLFIAEVTIELCEGSARLSEARFGWGRETASKGNPGKPAWSARRRFRNTTSRSGREANPRR